MGKGLKPTTGNPKGTDLKQARGSEVSNLERQVRPILPIDINAQPNVEPLIGRTNPTHVNFMFDFGRQSFTGTVPYGPLGTNPGGDYTESDRQIIKKLGKA
jgi:hypothetical protein